MTKNCSSRVAYILVLLCCAQCVNASDGFPDYPVRAAGEYPIKDEIAGLAIGIQLVEDPKDQKTYFHTELTPKGFVPVFIALENKSTSDSFIFDKAKITYGPADSSVTTPKAGEKAAEAVAIGSLAALSIAGSIVALKLAVNASHVQQELVKKEVQSMTLSPGASLHGFLYLRISKESPRDKIRLRVPVTRSGTDDTFVFNLVL